MTRCSTFGQRSATPRQASRRCCRQGLGEAPTTIRGRQARKYYFTQILSTLGHTNTNNTISNKYYQYKFTQTLSKQFDTNTIINISQKSYQFISNKYYQYFFTEILFNAISILFKVNAINIISHKNRFYQFHTNTFLTFSHHRTPKILSILFPTNVSMVPSILFPY